jgi:molybdate transport system ATP-binding protein
MSLQIELRHRGPPLDLALEIPDGEITALVGPSGSGKTSVLRAIAGLLRPDAGRIRYRGETWFDSAARLALPIRRRPVGFVPQSYGLFPHLTALANVETSLLDLPREARRQRARRALATTHVAGLEQRYPAELSGGQQQRVAVARAIAREPAVLLLDEPFSAVDRSTRKRLYPELKRLHQTLGATIVLVTHDLDEAAMLSSHMLLVHRGTLVQAGRTPAVVSAPATISAARLLDLPNVFSGTVLATDLLADRATLGWGPHRLQVPLAPGWEPDARVHWAIMPARVLLHRVDRPSRGTAENPVPGTIVDLVTLGDDVQVIVAPLGGPDAPLHLKVSAHVAQRNALAVGREIAVSVLGEAIIPLRDDTIRPGGKPA